MQTHWIANRAVSGEGQDEVAIVNPATEELIDTIPRGDVR